MHFLKRYIFWIMWTFSARQQKLFPSLLCETGSCLNRELPPTPRCALLTEKHKEIFRRQGSGWATDLAARYMAIWKGSNLHKLLSCPNKCLLCLHQKIEKYIHIFIYTYLHITKYTLPIIITATGGEHKFGSLTSPPKWDQTKYSELF